ncbi:MAG: sulfite reductase subunit alpha [Acidobacteriota bacterium]|nr:sulfite reductase subunit alpha [Acidobacteriota bacterium]
MQPPFIPDNSPFSEEQRAWLNGFLAGVFASAPARVVPADPPLSLKIAVLYASQSGTAETLARKLAKELKARGHVASLTSLAGYTPAALAEERHAILIASTYGEGDPPECVQPFFQQLCLEHFPRYQDLSFAVLALGDRNYEHFCRFGIDLDHKLAALGATRICDRVDCDVDLDDRFAAWKSSLLDRLDQTTKNLPARTAPATPSVTGRSSSEQTHTRHNPFLAPLIERRPLTCDVSSKLTLHVAFSIADSKLQYEAGDACGVVPENDQRLVAEILDTLKFSSEIPVQLPKSGTTTLLNALTSHLQITRLTRRTVQAYATIGQCQPLFNLLVPEQQWQLDKYTCDRGLIDLLHDYPGVLHEPADLVAMLPSLAPRLYSISSSPLAHPGEVHTTVAVVRYHSHNRDRGGVASTMLAERLSVGDSQPVYIQANKRFRLPADPSAPMIMIGPGTGIAPFRAFLHERRALGARGRNWLFFGERSAATDFLYRDELESMQHDGHLTRLDLAFSRDQDQKIYVQDRMLERSAEFYRWLQDGASVYVCGDASRMAKDVDATLHAIVSQQGKLSHEAAADYIQVLKDTNRYHRDVY